jgi:PAS domain S-box-containing protein
MQSKSEIQRLKNQLEAAAQAANIGIWDWDLLTGQLYWTPTLEALYGLAPNSVHSYDDFKSCVHPDDLESMEAARDAAVRLRQPFSLKFRIIRPDGSVRWIEANGRALYDPEGKVTNITGTNQDITDREKMELALKASEERYRTVVEDQTEVIGRVLPDGTFTFANEVYYRVFGTSADAVIGKVWHPITHPDDLPMVLAKLGGMTTDNPVVVIENRNFVAEKIGRASCRERVS